MQVDPRIADVQAALVSALTRDEPWLAGFDRTRLRAMSELLRAKRRRGVARSYPALRRTLGERFVSSFDEYASVTNVMSRDAPIDDALRFLEWLRDRDRLPRALRFLALRLRLQRLFRPFIERIP